MNRAADEITILDIITILEGPCTLVDCIENSSVCDKANICVARDIWNKLGTAIRLILGGYTLASLVEMHKLEGQQESMMYYI